MILKKLFDRIHHPHHHHHHHSSHNTHTHYENNQHLDMVSQTTATASLENEPFTSTSNETNNLTNPSHLPNRISSLPIFTDEPNPRHTLTRRPSICNETRTNSSDCLHTIKKNKQSSSSIYNEAENENVPHFYASSNSSQSDGVKVLISKPP